MGKYKRPSDELEEALALAFPVIINKLKEAGAQETDRDCANANGQGRFKADANTLTDCWCYLAGDRETPCREHKGEQSNLKIDTP
jgi:hypothetical protein